MPCVCAICGCRFDRMPGCRAGELWALVCVDCQGVLCPNCNSHDVYDLVDYAVSVPQHLAPSVRASVWGKPN